MPGPGSIIGVSVVRIARLTANGTPDFNNPLGGFTICGGISTFEHDFDVESGTDIYEQDAAGNSCVVRKRPDKVKRATFKLTLCRSDPRISEILGISSAVTAGQVVIGHAVKTSIGCGAQAGVVPNGVSIELWSDQWDCDAPHATPYVRAMMPRCYLTPKGYKRENGVSLPEFDGFSTANNNWGDGPFGDADNMVGQTGWCYAEMDDYQVPTCNVPLTYVNIPGAAS